MTLLQAIQTRHSVRHYISKPLTHEIIDALQAKIDQCNHEGHLHIQLVLNEKKGFNGIMAYGSFTGVENYLVMAGEKAPDLDYRIGYWGEQIVLLAQQLGLGTCWAGISYRKVKGTYRLAPKEKIACMISIGYPNDPGRNMRKKTVQELSNADSHTPEWFLRGVEAARLAPTAINQQKFHFDYLPPQGDTLPRVKASRGISIVGYTKMDLGIASLHFEIGAGKENFQWA